MAHMFYILQMFFLSPWIASFLRVRTVFYSRESLSQIFQGLKPELTFTSV